MYQKYYSPKGKRAGIASGRNNNVDYTVVLEAEDGEVSKLGVIKTDYVNGSVDGVTVIGIPLSDVTAIIEGGIMAEYLSEFADESKLKELRNMVGDDHVKMNIHWRR